jgi:hypothetical protein
MHTKFLYGNFNEILLRQEFIIQLDVIQLEGDFAKLEDLTAVIIKIQVFLQYDRDFSEIMLLPSSGSEYCINPADRL